MKIPNLAPLLTIIILLFSSFGCAGREDLTRTPKESPPPPVFRAEFLDLAGKVAELNNNLDLLQQEQTRQGNNIVQLRQTQAEEGVWLTELRDHLQQVRGALEVLRKEVASIASRGVKRDDELKEFRDNLDNLSFKINFLENFIGVSKRAEAPSPADRPKAPAPSAKAPAPSPSPAAPPPQPATPPPTTPPTKADIETAYNNAFEIFTKGRYEQARRDFQNFLKQFPQSDYSDNAQFWIAESYYFEDKLDLAVPEYEKVLQNFPKGNKYSHALLKLGISHARLGDHAKARTILQQLIRDFPNSIQARTARATLRDLR